MSEQNDVGAAYLAALKHSSPMPGQRSVARSQHWRRDLGNLQRHQHARMLRRGRRRLSRRLRPHFVHRGKRLPGRGYRRSTRNLSRTWHGNFLYLSLRPRSGTTPRTGTVNLATFCHHAFAACRSRVLRSVLHPLAGSDQSQRRAAGDPELF
jgi:hypothetical protein